MNRFIPAIVVVAFAVAVIAAGAQDSPPPAPNSNLPQPVAPATPPAQGNNHVSSKANSPSDNGPAANPHGRYQFTKTGDGIMRLDTQTGRLTFCGPRSLGWSCQVLPEDHAALESEIGRLVSKVESLEREIANLKTPPPPPASAPKSPDVPKQSNSGEIKLPTGRDLERARVFVEQAWRRLVDLIAHIQKDMMRNG
jgi:hypothetical protein